MRIIRTVGLSGSGEDRLAEMARNASIPVVTMGDIICKKCHKRDLGPTTDHEKIATTFHEEEGDNAITVRSLPMVKQHLKLNDVVPVGGLRLDIELDCFREAFGDDFALTSVEAPFKTCTGRPLDRGRDDGGADVETLKGRERRKFDFGIDDVMDCANAIIQNTGVLAEYHETIAKLFEEGSGALVKADA